MDYAIRFAKNVAIATSSSVLYEVAISGFDGKFQKFDAKHIEPNQVGIAAVSGAVVGSSVSFITFLFEFITADVNPYVNKRIMSEEIRYQTNPIKNWQ